MPSQNGLRRELGLLDATMINAGTTIASAIFIVPSTVALAFGATMPILLLWVVGGVVSLFGALCVAELGAAMPAAGGQYVYLGRAFHPVFGFLYGWTAFLIINTASVATIAHGFASYLARLVPLSPESLPAVASASIVALTLVNLRGIRTGAVTQNVFTLTKIGALAAIPVLALVLPGGSVERLEPMWQASGATMLAVGPALVAVLWAYDGWIESSYVGSEIKDPGRILPRSILYSTLLVTGIYVAANGAYLYLLGPGRMGSSLLVGADAMQVVMGQWGERFIAAAIVVATLGANNGIIFTAPRIPYAMATEGLFFGWATRLHPKTRSPNTLLLVQMVVAVAYTLSGTYNQLLTYVVFASFLFYALSAAAVIVLRRREPDLARPYRAWGYPVTPVLFILFAVYLVADSFVHTPRESAIGVGVVLLGLPAFFWWRRAKSLPLAQRGGEGRKEG
jgi:APA family basic amino acid/polyamine antiporter